jgi:DNA polymerase III sliding clamp (beta) subunit (PCNA family)
MTAQRDGDRLQRPLSEWTSSARSTAISVELHLADAANAPTLIRESEKSPALYVLMPMRV